MWKKIFKYILVLWGWLTVLSLLAYCTINIRRIYLGEFYLGESFIENIEIFFTRNGLTEFLILHLFYSFLYIAIVIRWFKRKET